MTKEFLHKKSLVLAKMFRESYERLGPDHRMTEILLERYRNTRRQIPGDYDRESGHSTRFGAYEAYLETQD